MVKEINFAAIIQARYNSKRFEGKILKKINNKSILEILINRLKKSKKINKIIIACSKNKNDKKIINLCKKLKMAYFVGSEENVLERYYKTAKKYKIKNIVRITSDCPLVDPSIVDNLINQYLINKVDYASNIINPTFPDGFDVEVLSFEILKKRFLLSRSKFEKEHVTTNIIKNKKYKKYSLELNKNYSNLRITIDTKNDLQILEKLLKRFNYNLNIKFQEIIEFYSKNKNFFRENSNFIRNSEMSLNTGQKLWIRAKNIIPGGTMLFSKNPDLQLPKKWPAYYSKAKKCYIWDCDGKKFTDIGLMGVGTNILGYSNKDVDKQVKRAVDNSNLSSLNCVEQIILAEKLIEIHPWSDMARFTRSGGEANAVAIRIARSYSGKDNVAFCGYHGWHDWYLSANLSNKNNLDKHLLKHLSVDGVPKKLKSTSFAFDYNDFQGLKRLVDEKNIGIIKMEVERNEKPKDNFLQKVRDLANKKNIILIFDECTSGFRSNFGGLHLNYRVYPDLAILGKALGNGYAINAIIGKKDIMKAVENTFISSTFWTEKIGYVAALETLKIMEKIKSWRTISSIGKKIRFNWQRLSRKYSLNLHIQGIDALPNFYFKLNKNNYYKIFICQEMLKRNILSSNSVYACIYHNDKILQSYFETLDEIFSKIKKCEDDKYNINNLLETDPSISGIRDYKKFI